MCAECMGSKALSNFSWTLILGPSPPGLDSPLGAITLSIDATP